MILLRKTASILAIISAAIGVMQFAWGIFPTQSEEVKIDEKAFCDGGAVDRSRANLSYFFQIQGHHISVPERIYYAYDKNESVQLHKSAINGRILEIEGDQKKHSLAYHRNFLPFWATIWLYFVPLLVFASETTQTNAWRLRIFGALAAIIIASFVLTIVMGDAAMVNETTLHYSEIGDF